MKVFFLALSIVSFILWFGTNSESSKSVSVIYAASALCATALHIFERWF